MRVKIAIYAFGATPVFFRHLIEFARAQSAPIDWCFILTSPVHRKIIGDVLPNEDILDLYKVLPRVPQGGDLSLLANYPGSMAEDLGAEKRPWRWRKGKDRIARGIDFHQIFKSFLTSRGATHLLCSLIESHDGKVAVATARELGLGVMIPNDCRNLTGCYFSHDALEGLPKYAEAMPEDFLRAQGFLTAFRADGTAAQSVARDYEPISNDDELLNNHLPSISRRFVGMVRKNLERPDIFDPDTIRVSFLNNLPVIRNSIWAARTRRAAREYDIETPEHLPKKYVFYPLHFTPEASINTPAPYYVDQFRAIDELRFAMPADCTLVVKEHRACIMSRPLSFIKRIRRIPGVLVAKYTIPARAIIERASLTASVTGTAAFEAFLLGRPALALGPGLSAWVLNQEPHAGSVRERFAAAFNQTIPDEAVIEKVARLFNVRYPFYFISPYSDEEPMLRRGNVVRMLAALMDHFERESHSAQRSCQSSQRATDPQLRESAL